MKSPFVAFVWMPLLALIAIGLTVAAMLAFVPPEKADDQHPTEWRPPAFWAETVTMCLAEVVFFTCMGYVVGGSRAGGPSAAVRNRVLSLAGVWLLIVLVSGAVAVNFPHTFFGDKIVFLQLIVTFILFLLTFLFVRQSSQIESARKSGWPCNPTRAAWTCCGARSWRWPIGGRGPPPIWTGWPSGWTR